MPQGTIPITINDITLKPIPGQEYFADYWHWLRLIADKKAPERDVMRSFCQQDLFFLTYFVLGVTDANHPFVIQAAKDIQAAPRSNVLYLFAREHFKTTLISKALTLQRILNNPQERACIFSYARPAAKSILRSLKLVLETSTFLHWCFPDMLYPEPSSQAPKWSEDDGLVIRRRGYYNEATLEAWGLIEGMPVGKHYSLRVYDDVSTEQTITSPEMMQKVKDMFDLSQNLGTRDGTHVVIGTPYHHEDTLMYIATKKDRDNNLLYTTMRKPATHDGTPTGTPVLLSERRLSELMSNRQMFYAQQLLDPTPISDVTLDPSLLVEIDPPSIPKNLYRFMTIDPAGQNNNRRGDCWAIVVWGVNPRLSSDSGASDFYILDGLASPFSDAEAIQSIVDMYLRNGRILKIGIEKMALSTAEIHVANALRAKGKHVSLENESIVLLRPGGRSKAQRITTNLQWPLNNSKIHLSKAVPNHFRETLKLEMRKFPFWHDDILDTLAYAYDMLADYKFAPLHPEATTDKTPWWHRSRSKSTSSWTVM